MRITTTSRITSSVTNAITCVGLLLFGACHGGGDDDPPDAPPVPPPELAWSPCPVLTGGTDTGAECGEADVPLRWEEPDGPRVHLFVKRIGDVGAPTQLWMLNGGPGASGSDFEPIARELARDGTFVFYLPDHRGTGRSTRLGCAAEDDASAGGFAIVDAEWDACVAELRERHGEDLAAFTTTQAARDVVWMIEQTRREGQAVNVWGGSYGTRWAQRYLQVEPAQASSVTLMGVVTADRHMGNYDEVYDEIGDAWLERCGADAFCAGRLGPDVVSRARAIWASLDGGQCAAAGLDKRTVRSFFAAIMLWSWDERALIPATLARLERCNTADLAALRYLRAVLAQPSAPNVNDRLQSSLLGMNISASELWPAEPPPIEALRAIDDAAIVSFGSAVRMAQRVPAWPRYTPDEHAGRYPETELPVLLINGEFDPATTADDAREVAMHFTRENQSLVIGRDATHSFTSPTAAGYWCFAALMVAFARSPTEPPLACAEDMLPRDFRGTPQVAAYFGTADLWDGGPPAVPVAPPDDTLVRRMRWAMP